MSSEAKGLEVINAKSAPQRQPDEEQRPGINKWNIAELEDFFKKATLPGNSIRLSKCEVITDVSKFINSHLSLCKTHDGNPAYKPYFDRLLALKEITVNLN